MVQNKPIHFHFQLFLSCLLHSISFALPPNLIIRKTDDNKDIIGLQGFKTSFNCFILVYLNIVSIEGTLLTLNFTSFIGFLMISSIEDILKQ